ALVSTLREVLSCRNGREAAERLFIHYNTLKYRLEQIRDLLGEEWDNPDFHAGLVVAIQLQKLRD
ncbi:helix-turn-helix domain-containing protein, partial [Gleimia europaea]|nr:helix-turn-helix domain-containing protein [Gleimia europaea]